MVEFSGVKVIPEILGNESPEFLAWPLIEEKSTLVVGVPTADCHVVSFVNVVTVACAEALALRTAATAAMRKKCFMAFKLLLSF